MNLTYIRIAADLAALIAILSVAISLAFTGAASFGVFTLMSFSYMISKFLYNTSRELLSFAM